MQPREVCVAVSDQLGFAWTQGWTAEHPTNQSTCMVQFVLPKGTCYCFSNGYLKKKNLLPILSDGILPVPVKWPKEHKHSCRWVRSTLLLKMLRKAEIPGGCRQAESNVFCLFWLRQPLTAQSSNQKLLSLRPWLPGNLPPLISIWFLFLFLFHQYSVTQSAPWPVLSPLRRAGFVPLYETSASMWSGKEIKHLGLGNLWP